MDALLRRRAMIASGGSSPTPPGPGTTIPYIRGGASGSYIDTGIAPDNTTKVIVWARNINPGCKFIFGSRVSSSSSKFYVASHDDSAIGRLRLEYITSGASSGEDLDIFSNYHKYELYNGVLSVDDVTKASVTSSSFTYTNNIHLFGINNGGTHTSVFFPYDVCACKIYKNNQLVRDLMPVSSPSVGFYDAVSGTTLTNAGTGSLTYGTFNSSAYVPLQYITCSGAQYIDTGIAGGYSLPLFARVAPNASTARWNIPISARYNTSNRCEFFFGNTSTANSTLSAGLASSTANIKVSSNFKNVNLILIKRNNVFTAYQNNTSLGSKTITCSSSFTTGQNLIIGGTFENGAFKPTESFEGKIYYVTVGGDGNFIPAKVGSGVGMYDTYNDVFYPSATGNDFVAGPEL